MRHDSQRMKAVLGKQGVIRSIIVVAVWFGLVGLLADSFVRPANAAVEKDLRIALVIGNSRYKDAPLKNPTNDAQLMAKSLRKLGFQVLEHVDVDQKGMKRAIQEFGDRLEKAGKDGVGLFYYAGHGVQANGRNYLIPLGAEIQRESDLEIEALRANAVLSTMDYARNRLNIVILDACRNNPYARSFRSVTRGLARMDAPRGTLIAYATGPGEVARDGKGANSPYTEALVKAMEEPDMPVEQMFKEVRLTVMAETNDIQVPWEASSLTGNFYFNRVAPTAEVAGKTQPKAEATPAAPELSVEMEFWRSIKGSKNPADFEGYLRKYPDGDFAILAKNRLASLVTKNIKKKSPIQTNEEQIARNKSETSFVGVYIGISTEGTTQLPIKITFKHLGDKVTGTYTLSGMLGTMHGTVSGNTFNYEWKLGGYSGLGVSIVQGNTINGTWGYNFSDNNAGTLTAQLQYKE